MTTADAEAFAEAARKHTKGKGNSHAGNDWAGTPIEPYPLEGPADFVKLKRPRFVVPGMVPEDGVFLLFAPSGHYKTTLMVLVLVLAANGKALDGGDIDPVPLVIAANEDPHGVKLRLRAAAQHLGLSLDNVRVLATGDFHLDNEEHRARLVAAAKLAFPKRRAALLVDHYDVSVSEKPTDPETGGKARDGLRDLVRRGFACAGILAHTPWTTSDRAKLPVSLWANMDARFGLTKREDGTAELHVDHVKNGEAGFTLTVRLVKVSVGLEDGPFETVAAEIATDATGAPVRGTKQKKGQAKELSDDQATALRAIERATLEHPAEHPGWEDIPRKAKLTREEKAVEKIATLLPRTTRTGKERDDKHQKEHAARILHQLHGRYLVRLVNRPQHGSYCWLDPKAERLGGDA
jgi:hypothetical protein